MVAVIVSLCATLALRVLLLHGLLVLLLCIELLLCLLGVCRARYALCGLVLDIVGGLRCSGGAGGFLRGRGHGDGHRDVFYVGRACWR